jgi:mono/diheme cytochrome c family protein
VSRASYLAVTLAVTASAVADAPRYAGGAETFNANCAVCHRANGAGNPGLAPPVIADAPRFLATAEGRRQLAMTVLYGMYGEITVAERRYNFKMPEFSRFDDAQLAEVLNYVVFDLGRADAALQPLSADELAHERTRVVDGAAVRAHRAAVVSAPP